MSNTDVTYTAASEVEAIERTFALEVLTGNGEWIRANMDREGAVINKLMRVTSAVNRLRAGDHVETYYNGVRETWRFVLLSKRGV